MTKISQIAIYRLRSEGHVLRTHIHHVLGIGGPETTRPILGWHRRRDHRSEREAQYESWR